MHQRVLFLILACAQVLGYAAQDAARVVQSTSAAANASAPQPAAANGLDIRLPLQSKSIRFAVIGDSGTGDRDQYQVAQEMETYRQKVGFDFVIMLGDNIYGSHHPNDFTQKFACRINRCWMLE
jgi:phosphodiesterase/alkaline phosphatase D-like protein